MSAGGPTLIVTGAEGQMGRAIVERFAAGAEVLALGRRDLDITDAAAVADAFATGERLVLDFSVPSAEGPRWLTGRVLPEPGADRALLDDLQRCRQRARAQEDREVVRLAARGHEDGVVQFPGRQPRQGFRLALEAFEGAPQRLGR